MRLLFYIDSLDEEIKSKIQDCIDDDSVQKIFVVSFEPSSFSGEKIENVIIDLKEVEKITYMGSKFAKSYVIACEIYEICRKQPIDIISFSGKLINAYFTLQFKYFYDEVLSTVEIFINKYLKTTVVNRYKFPYYWIGKKEKEVLGLCDFSSQYFFENPLEIRDSIMKKEKKSSMMGLYKKTNKEKGESCCSCKLSIIIPYYNLGEYIEASLESIIQSDMDNYEVIVVNDGSNDSESIEILKNIDVSYPQVQIINKKNEGLAEARNTGAKEARGEYIAFLDADDKVKLDYYKLGTGILDRYEEVSFVYSWVEMFGEKNDVWPTFSIDMPYFLLSNMLAAFPIIRKHDFLQHGMNRKDMDKGMEDYDAWINMALNGCIGVSIPKPLVEYRYRMDSMSKMFNRDTVLNLYYKIFDKHHDAYHEYSDEILKLLYSNGPGYLWNNPTMNYPEVALMSDGNFDDKKYELIRLANSGIGKLLLSIIFKLRINKLFK